MPSKAGGGGCESSIFLARCTHLDKRPGVVCGEHGSSEPAIVAFSPIPVLWPRADAELYCGRTVAIQMPPNGQESRDNEQPSRDGSSDQLGTWREVGSGLSLGHPLRSVATATGGRWDNQQSPSGHSLGPGWTFPLVRLPRESTALPGQPGTTTTDTQAYTAPSATGTKHSRLKSD